MKIAIVKDSHVTVSVNANIRVMVLLHRVWKKHPINVDYLGIYVPTDNHYSPLVDGLIGQASVDILMNPLPASGPVRIGWSASCFVLHQASSPWSPR